MARKTGRYGQVAWDPAGGTAYVPLISIKAWTGDFEPEYEDVTCFGDTNRVYIPGLMNTEGDFEGIYDAADFALWRAAMQPTPGALKLTPNMTEPANFFAGQAYMGASIDCSLEAPKVTGTWKAAAAWTVPGQVLATGAAPGTGSGSYTPGGASPPANFAALSGVTANPATAWTSGQRIVLGDSSLAHWNGTAWAVGPTP